MQQTDPVCGMKVNEDTPYQTHREDRTVYFCSESCKKQYDSNPRQFESGR